MATRRGHDHRDANPVLRAELAAHLREATNRYGLLLEGGVCTGPGEFPCPTADSLDAGERVEVSGWQVSHYFPGRGLAMVHRVIIEPDGSITPLDNRRCETMHLMADTENHVQCEGCGERVVVPTPHEADPMMARENPMMAREDSHSPAPGRVTIHFEGKVLHQCADGAYLPPDQVAPPKSN